MRLRIAHFDTYCYCSNYKKNGIILYLDLANVELSELSYLASLVMCYDLIIMTKISVGFSSSFSHSCFTNIVSLSHHKVLSIIQTQIGDILV